MEGVIDIALVKEQLRLLGHTVSDDVILSFIKGLGKGTASAAAAAAATRGHGDAASATSGSGSSSPSPADASPPAARDNDGACAPTGSSKPSSRQRSPEAGDGHAGHSSSKVGAVLGDAPRSGLLAGLDQRPASPKRLEGAAVSRPHARAAAAVATTTASSAAFTLTVPRLPACSASLSPASSSDLELNLTAAPRDAQRDARDADSGSDTSGSAASPDGASPDQQQPHGGGGSSRFLTQQAEALQCVRARLTARMAETGRGGTQCAGRPRPGDAASSDEDVSGSEQEEHDAQELEELPAFGFRHGYRPAGIHMPPPPALSSLEAVQAAGVWRQHRADAAARSSACATNPTAAPAATATPPSKTECSPARAAVAAAATAVQRLRTYQTQPPLLQIPVQASSSPACPRAACCLSPASGVAVGHASIIGGAGGGGASPGARRALPRLSGPVAAAADPLFAVPPTPPAGATLPSAPCNTPASTPAKKERPLACASGAACVSGPQQTGPRRERAGGAAASLGGVQAGQGARAAATAGSRRTNNSSSNSGGGGTRPSSAPRDRVAAGSGCAAHRPAPAAGGEPAPVRRLAGPASRTGSSGGRAASQESLYCERLAHAGGRAGRGAVVAPGVRKCDRVTRYQQLQQQWGRDKFLAGGAAGAAARKGGDGGAGA